MFTSTVYPQLLFEQFLMFERSNSIEYLSGLTSRSASGDPSADESSNVARLRIVRVQSITEYRKVTDQPRCRSRNYLRPLNRHAPRIIA